MVQVPLPDNTDKIHSLRPPGKLKIPKNKEILQKCTATIVKVKVKFAIEQATKAQRGSRFIVLLFLQPRR
jgi:hypothetical protein